MALKDLVASRQQLNEAAIEAIVKDYVRYDPEKEEIILTPAATGLPNKQKLLIYLVALEGWVYLKPELEEASAKPSELESALGIPGGTLRPLLRDLAAARLVRSDGGAYRIVAPNLESIRNAIVGRSGAPTSASIPASQRKRVKRPQQGGKRLNSAKPVDKARTPRRGKANATNAAAMFQSWIDKGFFSKPKSMRDMLEEFHNKGVIMKMTSLSKLPLSAVRSGALARRKGEQNGKQVWLYSSNE
jgi:hypothetical protein